MRLNQDALGAESVLDVGSAGRAAVTAVVSGQLLAVFLQEMLLGEDDRVMRVGAALRERGLLVGTIRPPTVPTGTARLRITLCATHTDEDVDALLQGLADVDV